MAIRDQWITPDEMTEISGLCKNLDSLRRLCEQYTKISVNLFEDEEGLGKTFTLSDSNGDVLGHIGFAEEGFALYLDDGKGE